MCARFVYSVDGLLLKTLAGQVLSGLRITDRAVGAVRLSPYRRRNGDKQHSTRFY